MNAKEYLSQALQAEAAMKARMEQISRLQILILRGKALQDHCGLESQLRELEEELHRDVRRFAAVKREITAVIDSVPQANYRLLLEYRYLCGWDMTRIAFRMNYSLDRIWHMHGEALREVKKILTGGDSKIIG